MIVNVPTHIFTECFIYRIGGFGEIDSYMMLETVLTHVAQQFPKPVDLAHGDSAVHPEWISGELALAEI